MTIKSSSIVRFSTRRFLVFRSHEEIERQRRGEHYCTQLAWNANSICLCFVLLPWCRVRLDRQSDISMWQSRLCRCVWMNLIRWLYSIVSAVALFVLASRSMTRQEAEPIMIQWTDKTLPILDVLNLVIGFETFSSDPAALLQLTTASDELSLLDTVVELSWQTVKANSNSATYLRRVFSFLLDHRIFSAVSISVKQGSMAMAIIGVFVVTYLLSHVIFGGRCFPVDFSLLFTYCISMHP